MDLVSLVVGFLMVGIVSLTLGMWVQLFVTERDSLSGWVGCLFFTITALFILADLSNLIKG